MNARIMKMFQDGNPDKLDSYIDDLDQDRFSLVTLIDSLVPCLVMESNLRFGSFHLIKMSLFLRNLSRRGVFSSETEKALARVVVKHLHYLEWIQITANPLSHAPDPVGQPLEDMLSEIQDGNVHNAYFYATLAYSKDKHRLFNSLLLNGTKSIPDTLGHSVSCFYPVLEEIIDVDHPASGTALLSLIMYLCRFRNSSSPHSLVDKAYQDQAFKSRLLCQSASGTGIVDIHHMITFTIFQTWETANWNTKTCPPWKMLADWIGDKTIDEVRFARAKNAATVNIPKDYATWKILFTEKNHEAIIDTALSILNESWTQACDWLFRVYADYYTPDWDPHYFTSLYAAFELCRDQSIARQDSQMALIQALEYFLDDID